MSELKEIKSNNSLKGKSLLKEQNKCNCQPLPNGVKGMLIILVIAIFIIVCVQLHYLGKLSDIGQAIKKSK